MAIIELMAVIGTGGIFRLEYGFQEGESSFAAYTDNTDTAGPWRGGNGGNSLFGVR